MIAVRESDGILSFMVRVQPRATRNEIDGEWQGALRIRLNVPPVDAARMRLCGASWPLI